MGCKVIPPGRHRRYGVLGDPRSRKGLMTMRWCLEIARVLYLYVPQPSHRLAEHWRRSTGDPAVLGGGGTGPLGPGTRNPVSAREHVDKT